MECRRLDFLQITAGAPGGDAVVREEMNLIAIEVGYRGALRCLLVPVVLAAPVRWALDLVLDHYPVSWGEVGGNDALDAWISFGCCGFELRYANSEIGQLLYQVLDVDVSNWHKGNKFLSQQC